MAKPRQLHMLELFLSTQVMVQENKRHAQQQICIKCCFFYWPTVHDPSRTDPWPTFWSQPTSWKPQYRILYYRNLSSGPVSVFIFLTNSLSKVFFPDTLPDFCQCCGSSGDRRYHIAIFAPLHGTMSDRSRRLAAWTAHTLMGSTGMLLRGPNWWAFLLLAENRAPSQQTTDSDTCIKHEAVGQCTKQNTRGAPWIQMLREYWLIRST